MDTLGALVKNTTNVRQSWGCHTLEPGTIGLMPPEIVASLRAHPMRELLVVDDHPEICPFVRTEHQPWSPRYQPGHQE